MGVSSEVRVGRDERVTDQVLQESSRLVNECGYDYYFVVAAGQMSDFRACKRPRLLVINECGELYVFAMLKE